MQSSGLGGLVHPMVWQYVQQPQTKLPDDIWSKYGKVFQNVWVATSFKGATGSAQYITDASYHLENHLNWVEIMKKFGGDSSKQYVKFVGTALTGWQRYDHFATLCDLLPAAIPSLAVCLQTLKHGYFSKPLHADISKKYLGCQKEVELRLLIDEEDRSYCEFPGHKFFYSIKTLHDIHKKKLDSDRIKFRLEGWLSKYNLIHNFTSPGQYKVFVKFSESIRQDLSDLRTELEKTLSDIYDEATVEEFLLVQIDGQVEKLDEWLKQFKSLSSRRVWPRRPLNGDKQDVPGETLLLYNHAKAEMKHPQMPNKPDTQVNKVPPRVPAKDRQLPGPESKGNVELPPIIGEKQKEAFGDNNMLIGDPNVKKSLVGNGLSGSEKGKPQLPIPDKANPINAEQVNPNNPGSVNPNNPGPVNPINPRQQAEALLRQKQIVKSQKGDGVQHLGEGGNPNLQLEHPEQRQEQVNGRFQVQQIGVPVQVLGDTRQHDKLGGPLGGKAHMEADRGNLNNMG